MASARSCVMVGEFVSSDSVMVTESACASRALGGSEGEGAGSSTSDEGEVGRKDSRALCVPQSAACGRMGIIGWSAGRTLRELVAVEWVATYVCAHARGC